ncbi:LysR family transcriptional regulator [Caproiciproducens sp. NJN-50]|uniref:LysR family transcriptional regulator n=1 Tax=Caproiciproducens sp. NJN-50 TaxID=2507162 RepID=UPI000FFE0213|nr:LysR family transcriptional regulator [Caproiciproducens sp. NJN-50]QAT48796.1 LysR family transcriptional regulator [Caproiciproducens sp. NJN-50]
MKLKYLKYVIALSSEKTLRKAAASLGISAVALSKYLKCYEDLIGYPLFDHHENCFTPTEEGEVYIAAAKKIIEVYESAKQEICNLNSGYTEKLLIGATPQRGESMVMKIFERFHKRYPNVQLRIIHTYPKHGKALLEREEINLLFCSYEEEDKKKFNLISYDIKEPLVLVVPEFHPAYAHNVLSFQKCKTDQYDGIVDIRDFQDSVFILYDHGTEARRQTELLFENAKFNPSIIYETNSPAIIIQLIQKGYGIGILPSFYAQKIENARTFATSFPIYLAHGFLINKRHSLSDAEKYFIQLVMEDASETQQI